MSRLHFRPRLVEDQGTRALVAGVMTLQSAIVAAYLCALLAMRGQPEALANLVLCSAYAPIEIVAAVMAWIASRAEPGRMRLGWVLIASGMACSAAINVEWLWHAFVPSHRFSWLTYAIAYAQYPLTLWALASFPRRGHRGTSRRTFLFDAAIVIVAGAVLAWHFVFREVLDRSGTSVITTVRALAYTALCLTVVSAGVTLFLRRPTPRLAVPLVVLIGAWVILGVADTLQMRVSVLGMSLTDVTFNACFAATAWLVTLAGAIFRCCAGPAETDGAQSPTIDEVPRFSRLPYAAIASVFGVLLLQAYHAAANANAQSTAPLIPLVGGAIVVTTIVVLRQTMAQRRNAALVAERLRAEARFRALAQHASDVVLVVDAAGIVRDASPSVAHTLGRPPESIVGRVLDELADSRDRVLVRADLAQLAAMSAPNATPRPSAPCEWRVVRGDGATRWLEVLCTNLLHDPAVRGIVVNARDVSERKALEAELTRQAHHDSLTGLVNRARFRHLVQEALRGRRDADGADRASLAVLYIDLDDFKPVNDTLGHGAGDRVLGVITERLRDATRGSDVVARLGGDEFALLLEHVRDVDEASAVARRALDRVQQPIAVDDTTVRVGASIGIVCMTVTPTDDAAIRATTCDALLNDADEAMYAAKSQGGRRHVVHGPHMMTR